MKKILFRLRCGLSSISTTQGRFQTIPPICPAASDRKPSFYSIIQVVLASGSGIPHSNSRARN